MARKPNIPVEDFIHGFFEKNIEIEYNRVVRFKGEDGAATIKDLRNRLVIDNYNGGYDFPSAVLFAALDAYLRKHDEKLLADVKKAIAFDGRDDSALRAWLEAVAGRVDAADLAVLKHFIWQVKRKLLGHLVTFHMMPVVYGKSGAGKSVAVDLLLAPLKPVTTKRDFTVFEDDRKWSVFHRYYVIVFDEMAKAARTDVNSMKSIISSDSVSYRLLATHEDAVGRNVATFMGTSNDPISDIVLDPTSARRFWQITSQDPIDWKTVNELDALGIWKCVDEASGVAPIASIWSEVAATQTASFRHKTPVEVWFEEHCEIDAAARTAPSTLYTAFKDWSSDNRMGTLISSTKFGKDLSGISGVERVRSGAARGYTVIAHKTSKDDRLAAKEPADVLPMAEKLAKKKNDEK